LMIPLALTSTKWSIRKLGRRWQALHRLIYFSALAGVVHYLWLVKIDKRKPEIYGAILAVLLLYRLAVWYQDRAVTAKSEVNGGQIASGQVLAEKS